MNSRNRIALITLLAFMGGSAYYASSTGVGMKGIHNQQTVNQVRQNCPDYYQTRNGDCLGRTFRSYFLIRGIRGGGFGGGGK